MDKILTRWSSINVNTTASVFILLLTILGTSLRRVLDTNLLSLAFVYSLQLMGMTSWTVMALVQLENELTSVERVQELLTIDDEEMIRLKKMVKRLMAILNTVYQLYLIQVLLKSLIYHFKLS